MKFHLLRTPWGKPKWVDWGFCIFCFEEEEVFKTWSLFGISGDYTTGVIWLDILFFTIKLREER